MIKQPFHITNFLTPPSTEISHFLAADNQLVICNGVNPSYKLGKLIKDLGYSQVGDTLQASKAITGLHHFRQSPTVNKVLATVNNSGDTALVLKYNNAGTWTDINTSTTYTGYKDCLVEMEDFIGYCFIVGYDSTDNVFLPVGSLTGTTFSTSTNVTDMPMGKYIKRYRDRLYAANCYIGSTAYPYRVYYSSVPSAGAITWTQATDFIDVDYSEQITGLGENWDKLMIFTEFSAYAYDQTSKKKVWDVGGLHRTIQNIGSWMIFANKDNVYVSSGGLPQAIGNDILELIRSSTTSNWRSAVVDNEYKLFLGGTDANPIEANGIGYVNCEVTYNFQTGMWRWRELYDSVTAMARYTSGSDDFAYMGMSDGEVMVKSKYTDTTPVYSDDTQPISSHFRTKAFDFGDPSIKKFVYKLMAYADKAQQLHLSYRLFDKNQDVLCTFKPIGNLTQVVNEFNKTIKGNFIQFEGKEMSTKQSWEFYGLTALLQADDKK